MDKATEQPKFENIYKLDGRVPILKAIPFGIQHVLSMFVANIVPIILIAGVAKYRGIALNDVDKTMLIQAAMIIAGIGTIIQLYPLWKIGAGLPIVMGMSFTFLGTAMAIGSKDYGSLLGAIIVGGILEGLLGLTAHRWRHFIPPIVPACVVLAIGFSLFPVGISSFSGGVANAGNLTHICIAFLTLISSILFQAYVKEPYRQLYVIFGIFVGYTASLITTYSGIEAIIDFNPLFKTYSTAGMICFPQFFPYAPNFNMVDIISISIVFLVSATETIGDTTAICRGGLNRDVTDKEISGSLCCDGLISSMSAGVFGCMPITSFSQNVGLVAMTKVVNLFTIMTGAVVMIIAGLIPPIGALIATIPDCVMGGCTITMFGAIAISGINMFNSCKLTPNNTVIASLALGLGIGVTQCPSFFAQMPELVKGIFQTNSVAGVFVIAMILSLLLPKHIQTKNPPDSIETNPDK